MEKRKGLLGFAGIILLIAVVGSLGAAFLNVNTEERMETFKSCDQMINTFNEARESQQNAWKARGLGEVQMFSTTADGAAAPSAVPEAGGAEYSETNVQVAGVDEADIVKTDGEYVYTITQGQVYYYEGAGDGTGSRLIIAKAYPAEEAAILSETDLGEFSPTEIFIDGDRLLIFGTTYVEVEAEEPLYGVAQGGASVDGIAVNSVSVEAEDVATTPSSGDSVDDPEKVTEGEAAASADVMEKEYLVPPDSYPYMRRIYLLTAQLWDISDRENPELVRTVDFEGSYVTSRKIGDYAYFIVNSYPEYSILDTVAAPAYKGEELIPLYRDSAEGTDEYEPACGCEDVGYYEGVNPERFVTIVSMSMADDDAAVQKETILGSGSNVYASLENIYVAETTWPYWPVRTFAAASDVANDDYVEKTVVHKFSLDGGQIEYQNEGEVPGYILNQFSMDEYDGNFRIATTVGHVSRSSEATSSNNVYVLGPDMEIVGQIEGIAPGEQIYSARFIGDRGYLVTFKKIDPFFIIDLSDPTNPEILGKLKIPGYSDYLHPYDENHIIGIGKDTEEAEEESGNFAWYQGLKMALFDVTDVSNPKEMYSVVIGDRGTDSYALHDHRAFLFDRDKNLLVIPVLLAEINGDVSELPRWSYGDYVFQGAYVYDVTLEDGFQLKGRITHFDDDDAFAKSGYYFEGGDYTVKRSLYIGDVLYTLSGMKLKLNSLTDLSELKELVFG